MHTHTIHSLFIVVVIRRGQLCSPDHHHRPTLFTTTQTLGSPHTTADILKLCTYVRAHGASDKGKMCMYVLLLHENIIILCKLLCVYQSVMYKVPLSRLKSYSPFWYCYYYMVGKGSSWYKTHIAWEILVFYMQATRPRGFALVLVPVYFISTRSHALSIM